MRADLAELVDQGETAEDDPVVDGHVAGQRRGVGENRVVADHAIMGDVHVGHQPVVVADAGHPAAFLGAAIEGDEFADHVAVANLQARLFTVEFLVLRRRAERGELPDPVVAADPGRPVDDHVRPDRRAIADFHILADDAESADADVAADFRARIDQR